MQNRVCFVYFSMTAESKPIKKEENKKDRAGIWRDAMLPYTFICLADGGEFSPPSTPGQCTQTSKGLDRKKYW